MGIKPLMLDLFCGLGGASQAMKQMGWSVVTVDIDPSFNPDVVADIRDFSWHGERPHLIWASPPCTEFSRESMPWTRTGRMPDMSLVLAALRIVREARPTYWIVENVRGAVRWFRPLLGSPRAIVGPFYLWGWFPELPPVDTSTWQKKRAGRQRRGQSVRVFRMS